MYKCGHLCVYICQLACIEIRAQSSILSSKGMEKSIIYCLDSLEGAKFVPKMKSVCCVEVV